MFPKFLVSSRARAGFVTNQFQRHEPIVYPYGVPCPYYPVDHVPPPPPKNLPIEEMPMLPSDEEGMPPLPGSTELSEEIESGQAKIREESGMIQPSGQIYLHPHAEIGANLSSRQAAPVLYPSPPVGECSFENSASLLCYLFTFRVPSLGTSFASHSVLFGQAGGGSSSNHICPSPNEI
jgi:hypothetical protein